jgi:putative flippase GtrA
VRFLARYQSFLRFFTVGVLSLGTDAGALFILHGVLRIWLPVATATAYAIAFVVNFGLNKIWVFRAAGTLGRQLQRYVGLVVVNLVVTVCAVQLLTWLGMQYLFAKVFIALVLAVANFLVSRRWIFVAAT